jgi:phosphatidylinositol glycan class W
MPAPPLLEAINRNALAVFLLVRSSLSPSLNVRLKMGWIYVGQANVVTGVVNLSMRTMYASDGRAMAVLAAYAFGVCVFAWAFRGRRLWKL